MESEMRSCPNVLLPTPQCATNLLHNHAFSAVARHGMLRQGLQVMQDIFGGSCYVIYHLISYFIPRPAAFFIYNNLRCLQQSRTGAPTCFLPIHRKQSIIKPLPIAESSTARSLPSLSFTVVWLRGEIQPAIFPISRGYLLTLPPSLH